MVESSADSQAEEREIYLIVMALFVYMHEHVYKYGFLVTHYINVFGYF